MRILVVTQYFWPENFRINDLVSDWVERGHAVTVLTGAPNYPEGKIYPEFLKAPERFHQYAGARIIRIPVFSRGKGYAHLLLNYLSFIISGVIFGTRRLRGLDFDAIFVFQTSPITVALPAIWFRLTKHAPILMWVLDLWPESVAAVGAVTSKRAQKWLGYLVSFIYRRCDRILVQSKAFIPNILKYSGRIEQVRYFPNWAEPIFHAPLEEVPIAQELAPYQNSFNVLFAGNVGEAQDFPAILEAAEILKARTDICWLIVGDGRVSNWVRTEISQRGLENSVFLLGRHPLERMPNFFRGAQALLVSLRKDPIFTLTIPGKIQSYLAVGLPILALLDGEGARVLQESGASLVAPSGAGTTLAENVLLLANMQENDRKVFGKHGAAYCNIEFNRQILLDALESWIQELVVPTTSSITPIQPEMKS